ncbi:MULTISPECIES: pyrroline-5-carboxylate reductase [Bacillus]|uniref:pyrroline-5-carboxylate reductase n=1 Tax=Bacillus TaxID=1386 RepID=UPI0030F6CF6D
MSKIGFIGAGSMAESMIKGLLKSGIMSNEDIIVTNKTNEKRLEELNARYGVKTDFARSFIYEEADMLVFALKPKDAESGISEVRPHLNGQLIISILAGISIETIQHYAGAKTAVVRAMPNTSAAIQQSATGIAVSDEVTEAQKEKAVQLFETIGHVTVLDESQLNAVTAIAGSGPAFIYHLIEGMERGASELGMDQETAKLLICQMIAGAANMLQDSGKEPTELRKEITSEGGTTEAGLNTLASYQFEEAIVDCVKTATKRAAELNDMFSASTYK